MEKYKSNPQDTLENNIYRGCLNEEFIKLSGDMNAPFFAYQVGVTNPDKNYFIHREVCSQIILEFVVSGEGFVEVDGKREVVSEGDVYLILPQNKHSYGADKDNPYKKIWINFTSPLFLNIIYTFALNEKFVYHAGERILPEFEKLLEVAQTHFTSDNVQLELSKIVYSILADISSIKDDSVLPSNAFTRRVYSVLNGNIYGKPKIKELAQKLCVSEAYLIRQFKSVYGITPYKFLLNKKIETAKKLLLFTQKNITEIAQELGFDNEHYFSDIFKQKTGLSPSLYRKQTINAPPHEE